LKNGKKPTLKQTGILAKNKMDSSMWLVSKVLSDRLVCIHKHTFEVKEAYYMVAAI